MFINLSRGDKGRDIIDRTYIMISEHEFQQIGEKSSVELMFAMMAYKTQLQNSLKEILTQSEINSIKFSVIDQGVIDKLVLSSTYKCNFLGADNKQ